MESDNNQYYHRLVTDYQSTLYAFVCSLMGGSKNAHDVLQEVNLVLWKKAAEYDSTREFKPWAFRIAYLQVLAYRRSQERDRLVFDDGLVGTLAAEFTGEIDSRLAPLDKCIETLSDSHRKLLQLHYKDGQAVSAIAQSVGRTGNAIAATLYRIRKTLSECVERTLRTEDSR